MECMRACYVDASGQFDGQMTGQGTGTGKRIVIYFLIVLQQGRKCVLY